MHQIVRKSLLISLCQRGGRGDFQANEYSIMSSLIDTEEKTNVRIRK